MAEEKKRKKSCKQLDAFAFEQLCGIQCTKSEIASFFMVSEPTVDSWCERRYNMGFKECFERFSGKGKVSLRRNQFKMSETNPTMAIWLGKQYLGQRDCYDNNVNVDIPSDGLFNALQKGLLKDKDKKDD